MGDQVDPELSRKRAEAGRRGAESRWAKAKRGTPAKDWRKGLEQFRNEKPKDQPSWRIENAAGEQDGPAELYIYDEIDSWFGVGARDVTQALMGVTTDTITVHLNSPGGDIFEAHAIYNALRAHKATVNVVVDGIAASAASYIAQAGDTIEMASNATMMIHDAIGFTYGNAADHAETADILDKQSDIIAGIYAERAGGTVDEWRASMRAESWYNAEEAVAAGLADGILDHTGSASNNATTALYGDAARKLAATTREPDPEPDATDDQAEHVDDFGAFTDALKGALV